MHPLRATGAFILTLTGFMYWLKIEQEKNPQSEIPEPIIGLLALIPAIGAFLLAL